MQILSVRPEKNLFFCLRKRKKFRFFLFVLLLFVFRFHLLSNQQSMSKSIYIRILFSNKCKTLSLSVNSVRIKSRHINACERVWHRQNANVNRIDELVNTVFVVSKPYANHSHGLVTLHTNSTQRICFTYARRHTKSDTKWMRKHGYKTNEAKDTRKLQ